jgi:hypothetical protein
MTGTRFQSTSRFATGCLLLLASGLAAGCNTPGGGSGTTRHPGTGNASVEIDGENRHLKVEGAGGASRRDQADFGGHNDNTFYKQYDVTKEQYDNRAYNAFIRTRCLELGRALANLSAEEKDRADLAESDIREWMKADDRTVAEFVKKNAEKKKTAADAYGFVIPRYIRTELDKPKAEWRLDWLRINGSLLRITYDFETLSRATWYDAAASMMKFGVIGREFLAAQMVVRMRLANADYRDIAKDVLVQLVPEEAISPLIAATHVEIAGQPGVFPKETASVLAQIGKKAVPKILEEFQDKDRKHLAATDETWGSRRYFVDALGAIGDPRAVDTLVAELEGMSFKSDVRRAVYGERVVLSLGGIGDKRAVGPIVKFWKSFSDASDFVKPARAALFQILGKSFDEPEKVPVS